MKYFDLNMKKILDNWGLENATREIIANALDESIITESKDIEVWKDGNFWYIRDFGRGLKIENFSQNESKEKMQHDRVIGNYGVGLKDAIAVFFKKGIEVEIETGEFIARPVMHQKEGFNQKTIHIAIEEEQSDFIGTQFKLGINDRTMDKTRELFLFFKEQKSIFNGEWGEIFEDNKGEIYLNGLVIAQNSNFTFSYNILKKSKKLMKNLNRERTNVGKEAFSDLISKIVIDSNSKDIAQKIEEDRETSEEFKIKATREFVYGIAYEGFFIVTQGEFEALTDDYKKIITKSGKVIKIVPQKDIAFFRGNDKFPSIEGFFSDYQESLVVDEIKLKELSKDEKKNLELIFSTFKTLNKWMTLNFNKKSIKVTDGVKDLVGNVVLGTWRQSNRTINISREALVSEECAISTFLHEVAHSINDHDDGTREFEDDLGRMIWFAAKYLKV